MMRNMNSMIEPLWQGTLAGTLPPTWPDLTVDAGQALQLEMLDRWLANGERLAGYKIGLTSGKMRDAFGPGVRPFGYILASRVHQSGDRVRLADIGRMGVENELVFRVGQDIFTPTATARDASMVVDRVAPGFEINQTRTGGNASSGLRVADNLSQWGIVTGHFIPPRPNYDDLVVHLARDGDTVASVASRGHIDDHYVSIAALINRLYKYGRGLKTGQLIITGSLTRQAVDAPSIWAGDFGSIGEVTLTVQ